MKPAIQQVGIIKETNRTFLVDKDQAKKSVFNLGHYRHNVHSRDAKEQSEFSAFKAGIIKEPVRLMEWNQDHVRGTRTGFASPRFKEQREITGKIG